MQSKSEENIAPASTEVSVAPVAAEKPVEAPAATTALAAEGQTDGETTGQTKVEAPMSTTEQTEESTDNASQTPATKDDPAAAPGKINAQQEKAQTALDDNKAEDATKAMASASISDATAAGVGARPSAPLWPETGPEHPLTQFYAALPDLTSEASHSEVYGIPLSHENPFHTKLILQKFLRANANDLGKAKEQLLKTLKWRKEYDPVGAAAATYDKDRFEGLGYIIEVEGVPGSDGARADGKDVITFNVYGAVKDNKKTFGDMDGFLKWRVGLMERSVQKLNLAAATKPIPDYGTGPDPYQGYQVHDYLQVSYIRQDPLVRTAAKRTIQTISAYYPETLSRKFFVNVPVLMGWVFSAMKLLVAKETTRKFTVVSYGEHLVGELGKAIPKAYGGEKEGELDSCGETMKLV